VIDECFLITLEGDPQLTAPTINPCSSCWTLIFDWGLERRLGLAIRGLPNDPYTFCVITDCSLLRWCLSRVSGMFVSPLQGK